MRPFSTSCFDEFGKKKNNTRQTKTKPYQSPCRTCSTIQHVSSLSNHVIDICDEVIAVDVS